MNVQPQSCTLGMEHRPYGCSEGTALMVLLPMPTGMRRSFRTHSHAPCESQGFTLGWYALPRWGKRRRQRTGYGMPSSSHYRCTVFPSPNGACAYQPRVQPWVGNIDYIRVLKERRISPCYQSTPNISAQSQGFTMGLVCVAPLGLWADPCPGYEKGMIENQLQCSLFPSPKGACAYQPRMQPWVGNMEHFRALKERRISPCYQSTPDVCGVPSERIPMHHANPRVSPWAGMHRPVGARIANPGLHADAPIWVIIH